MSFLRNRDELLTDYLREQISTGKVASPLPNSRAWAKNLGVGCRTLYRSLHALECEGLIEIKSRKGIFIKRAAKKRHLPQTINTVRIVYQGGDYTDSHVRNRWGDLLFLLSQSLKLHGIDLILEKCTDGRLRAISKVPKEDCRHELLLLRSLSEKHQRLFAECGRPSLVLGYCTPQIRLPYVSFDLEGAIRHATHRFFRRGHTHVWLLANYNKSYGMQRQRDAFTAACHSWTQSPVSGEIVSVSMRQNAQLEALRRFSSRPQKKHGIIVLAPLIFTTVVVAFLRNRGNIFQDVEIASVGAGMPDPSVMWPDEVHYNLSVDSAIKVITHIAVHFFKTGMLSQAGKVIPVEISKP